MKPTKKQRRGLIAAFAVLLALLGGITYCSVRSDTTETAAQVNAEPEETFKDYSEPPAETSPVELQDWQEEPSTRNVEDLTDAEREHAREVIANTPYQAAANTILFPEDAGFTSDLTQATNPDGSLNPLYSYWTDGLFQEQSIVVAENFINPLYGNWAIYQEPNSNAAKNFDVTPFYGIVTDEYATQIAEAKDKSSFPVFADWKNNSYGASSPVEASGAYWIGSIQESKATWKWSDELLGYRVSSTFKVEFVGKASDGSTLTKTGTLKLVFVPAPFEQAEAGGFRVQVESGSLKVG